MAAKGYHALSVPSPVLMDKKEVRFSSYHEGQEFRAKFIALQIALRSHPAEWGTA